jgi:hypothetical protein
MHNYIFLLVTSLVFEPFPIIINMLTGKPLWLQVIIAFLIEVGSDCSLGSVDKYYNGPVVCQLR